MQLNWKQTEIITRGSPTPFEKEIASGKLGAIKTVGHCSAGFPTGFPTCSIADFQVGWAIQLGQACGFGNRFGNPRYSRFGNLRYEEAFDGARQF